MKNRLPFLSVCFSVVCGLLVAYLILPFIVRYLPNEQDRLKLIKSSFDNRSIPQPEIVIAGPSSAMSVDGRKLSELLPHKPVVWNITSPGQMLIESFIILQNASPNIKKVILAVPAGNLMRGGNLTHKGKMVLYKMYDYHITPEILESISRSGNPENTYSFFTQPYWQSMLQSRWVIQNSINSFLTFRVRDDLDYKQLRENIFLPFPFRENKEFKTVRKTVRKRKKNRDITEFFKPLDNSLQLMDDIKNSLAEKNIELIILIVPDHPFEIEAKGEKYYSQLDEWIQKVRTEKKYKILNYNRLVTNAAYFVDRMHTNLTGGEIITKQLAQDLTANQ